VLPVNTAENANPIISNALTVLTTDSVRILGLSDDLNALILPLANNSYNDYVAVIPTNYFSSVNIDLFNAFIFNYGNSFKFARYYHAEQQNSATPNT
jgi:hypothetical protein